MCCLLFVSSVCVFCVLLIATMFYAGYFLVRSLLSAFFAILQTYSRLDLVWFRPSCDHGWIRSGSVKCEINNNSNNPVDSYC